MNEVVVPLGAKDKFNAWFPPSTTGSSQRKVLDPQIQLIPVLYPGVQVPAAPRNDIATIFLTGIPGLNQPDNVQPSEMIRLNYDIKPTTSDPDAEPSRSARR